MEIDKTVYSIAPWYNKILVRIAQKDPMLFEIFDFFNTVGYRTKLCANVPKINYFAPIILKFKKFIYNSNTKIIHKFYIDGAILPPVVGEVTSQGRNIFTVCI